MLSFRSSMSLFAAAALAVAIGMLLHAHQTSNASARKALASVVVKAPPEYWFPRASTYADEVANANHEGF
jgi:hypothetical protein